MMLSLKWSGRSIPVVRPVLLICNQANEVLPVVEYTPVLAGVCASDPFKNIPRFLRQLKDIGIVGVQVSALQASSMSKWLTRHYQNFPTLAEM